MYKRTPANILVIGGGVADLTAKGQTKNVGTVMRAFDSWPAVKVQVESMEADLLTVEIK